MQQVEQQAGLRIRRPGMAGPPVMSLGDAVMIEGISERAAADRFGINARTVSKMLKFSVPPGYVRKRPPLRPKLDGFTGIIDAILTADRDSLKKQHHGSCRGSRPQ
jgi:hypothetical protein